VRRDIGNSYVTAGNAEARLGWGFSFNLRRAEKRSSGLTREYSPGWKPYPPSTTTRKNPEPPATGTSYAPLWRPVAPGNVCHVPLENPGRVSMR